jgi:hypothetical protein
VHGPGADPDVHRNARVRINIPYRKLGEN